MTDLVTRPVEAPGADGEPTRPLDAQWAPEEEQPRSNKKRVAWFIGAPSALLIIGAAVVSALVIAPGVTAAGQDIGFRTPGAAAGDISNHLANTEVTISGSAGDITLPATELGASVDAQAAANLAHSERPAWNIGEWNSGAVNAPITVDQEQALAAITAAAPEMFTEPTSASVDFADGTFRATEGTPGVGIDIESFTAALSSALAENAGVDAVTVVADPVEVAPLVSVEAAQTEADALNQLVNDAGFYVGDELAVDIDPAQLASWITVTEDGGEFTIDVDEAAVGEFAAGVPDQINREAVTADVVTNSSGETLRAITEGQDGWQVQNPESLAADFAASIESGNGHFEVAVETVEHEVNNLHRRVEVNLAAGTTTMIENDQVVASYDVAIGKSGHETIPGNFVVQAQLEQQDMGDCNGNDWGYGYCTENVKWVTYFNGDQGFHGTYWHNNFGAGAAMSHGCVNMTDAAAYEMYRFAQLGTEVTVY